MIYRCDFDLFQRRVRDQDDDLLASILHGEPHGSEARVRDGGLSNGKQWHGSPLPYDQRLQRRMLSANLHGPDR